MDEQRDRRLPVNSRYCEGPHGRITRAIVTWNTGKPRADMSSVSGLLSGEGTRAAMIAFVVTSNPLAVGTPSTATVIYGLHLASLFTSG